VPDPTHDGSGNLSAARMRELMALHARVDMMMYHHAVVNFALQHGSKKGPGACTADRMSIGDDY